MRTSESASPDRVRESVEAIFDARLAEAAAAIRTDLLALDAHFSPSQISEALMLALFRAKAQAQFVR